jgi:hypothetical protein
VNSDENNCGACGNVCGGSTPVCIQGTCGNCPPPLTNCNGVCSYLESDFVNCGACGHQCQFGEGCLDGQCFPQGE